MFYYYYERRILILIYIGYLLKHSYHWYINTICDTLEYTKQHPDNRLTDFVNDFCSIVCACVTHKISMVSILFQPKYSNNKYRTILFLASFLRNVIEKMVLKNGFVIAKKKKKKFSLKGGQVNKWLKYKWQMYCNFISVLFYFFK